MKRGLKRRLLPDERGPIEGALKTLEVAPAPVIDAALAATWLCRMEPRSREIRDLRSLVAWAALRSRATGITLGDWIFIRRDAFDSDRPPLWLVAHEVTHVVQYRRDGLWPFVTRYFRDYARGRLDGLGDLGAYRAIPCEVEARRVAELV